MRWFAHTLMALLIMAFPAFSQDSDTRERGYLQAYLEDNLSGAGREVRITGFAGALSSEASIEELTIADDKGVWITLKTVVLNWNRSDLLAGRLNVTSLTAKEILLPRLPETGDGLSPDAAVAREFRLPELPVAVEIGKIKAERVVLGKPVIGSEVEVSLEGEASLAEGEGDGALDILRRDGKGALTLAVSYADETQTLAVALDASEDQGGIAATWLGIPGQPALSIGIEGQGPLSDFLANVVLTSAGDLRLSGSLRVFDARTDPENPADKVSERWFTADLEGDLASLFEPRYQAFFGEKSHLKLTGTRAEDGALEILDLSLGAAALSVTGALGLDADGWPTHFRLTADLGTGERLRLPLTDAETWIERAQIDGRFNATSGDEWQADISIDGLARDGLDIGSATLEAKGRISRDRPDDVTAALTFALSGLSHDDPDTARALAAGMAGSTRLGWRRGEPLRIEELDMRAGDVAITGAGRIDGLAKGFPASGALRLQAADLGRFGSLAGRDLAGAVNAEVTGKGDLLGGGFDVAISAEIVALETSMPRIDPLFRGTSALGLIARRDTDGTVIERLEIDNDAIALNASARTDNEHGRLDLSARVQEVSLVEPRLIGPAEIEAGIRWVFEGDITIETLTLGIADAVLTATGEVSPTIPGMPATGKVTAKVRDASRFSVLAGRRLSGRAEVTATGRGLITGNELRLTTRIAGQNLATGSAQLDTLLRGAVLIEAEGARTPDALDLRKMSLASPRLTLTADAVDDSISAPLDIRMRLADLGLYAPELRGPLEVRGRVDLIGPDAKRIVVTLDATGPGGTRADIRGDVFDIGAWFDLTAAGQAPLALANSYIAPRLVLGNLGYDLRFVGPPALASVSGTFRTSDGRLALPQLGLALQNVTGSVGMASGSAQVDLQGQFRDGGRFTLSGPVGLTAPYPSALNAVLSSVRLTDGLIYSTTAGGPVSVTGPLIGGARITGTVTLAETEIRIPAAGAPNMVMLDGMVHVNEPPGVRQTRRWAGLIQPPRQAALDPLALDLVIDAPRRLFVRGRGLDAELGGRVRLGGTTSDVQPSGSFQLIRGRLDLLGKRLTMTEGLVDLRGALDPYLRFVAETSAADVIARIVVEGLASDMRISFNSEPELPEEEIVSQLLLGRGLDRISPLQAAQLASAVATLAGRGGDGIVGRLRGAIGLSDLDVTSTEDGNTQLRAGTYLSDNVYSEVTADSEGRREINLNLDVSPTVTLKGGVGNDGSTGLGVFFEKDY